MMKDENTIKENRNYELAKHFLENKTKIHIVKKDGTFYNGYIVEIKLDFFFIDDRVDGKKLVFFLELSKDIEEYKKEGSHK